MSYDYRAVKEALTPNISKIDLAKKLNITRPTLDGWLKKYDRDTKLIKEFGSPELVGQLVSYAIRLYNEPDNFDMSLITELIKEDEWNIAQRDLQEHYGIRELNTKLTTNSKCVHTVCKAIRKNI